MKYIICAIYILLSISGLTFIKLGSNENVKILFEILGLKFSIQTITGYCCYILSFLLYTIIIPKFNLSYINPILGGISNIMILVVAVWILNEKLTKFSLIGSAFIIIGVFLMNIKP